MPLSRPEKAILFLFRDGKSAGLVCFGVPAHKKKPLATEQLFRRTPDVHD
jgi:hypothetical protein